MSVKCVEECVAQTKAVSSVVVSPNGLEAPGRQGIGKHAVLCQLLSPNRHALCHVQTRALTK